MVVHDEVRTAELVACLSLATDLALGLPREHGLESAIIGARLSRGLGVDDHTAAQAYYGCLLYYIGCTADAEISAALFPWGTLLENFNPVIYGSPGEAVRGVVRSIPAPEATGLTRVLQIARTLPRAMRGHPAHMTAMCEVAQMLGERIGLPASIHGLFGQLTERWDGKGGLHGLKGDAIPLALRIVSVARDVSMQKWVGGVEYAVDIIHKRAGGGHDPHVAEYFCAHADEVVPGAREPLWDVVLSCEPGEPLTLRGSAIDEALAAMGDFADLAAPCLSGHSDGVARLTQAAAKRMGLDAEAQRDVVRAARVHDLGRVAVSPAVWEKPGPLTADEREQVRLHAYHTERLLASSPFLARLAATASAHHERCDGSGYHRGVGVAALSPAARLLAVADAYHTMTEPRPHLPATSLPDAAAALRAHGRDGRLDAEAVHAVLDASGQAPPRRRVHPAGLTDREVEVLGLLAHGFQIKQIGRRLGISTKTASRHVQNIYPKIGVSTRAAAAVFAMQHGLAGWGERPIVTERPGS
ncbi:HD domain-containing phosphohydrolase [Lentzea nigeriaca]|uniref:HD domain-containing phosphohydrolase n=1 Tax=Lentzea nigeriaca TaxID=1128665 RepID=UPI001957143C|nr:HD domain-containing phosphohydrolase [Lentzea nigeriaca]MBM7864925.1 HD-GYP domain-containing protein (c-di-GMP phosphodiesterase class II) [Lentzea nigeriaca]